MNKVNSLARLCFKPEGWMPCTRPNSSSASSHVDSLMQLCQTSKSSRGMTDPSISNRMSAPSKFILAGFFLSFFFKQCLLTHSLH